MRPALVVTLSIACALALAGCGGDASPETRPLVLVTSEDPASLAATAEAFTTRNGRSVELRALGPDEGVPERFDLLLLASDAAPFLSASPELLGALHAWPLARAGADAHHEAGLWVGVARSRSGLLAAGVSASSDIEQDAREMVAFLLSDEGQAALGALDGLDPIVEPAP
jgi:ABC-type glycerol-3-phosphate transport system substrate-binding protein